MGDTFIDNVEIGKRVRALRLSCGYTQEALAEEVGISPTFISHIERGTKHASLSVIVSLSFALETTIDYILYGPRDLSDSLFGSELGLLLQDCSPAERHIIIETSKALKQALHG